MAPEMPEMSKKQLASDEWGGKNYETRLSTVHITNNYLSGFFLLEVEKCSSFGRRDLMGD